MPNDQANIIGFPLVDGAYWYYRLGEPLPRMVLVGTYQGERAIKEGAVVQRYWYPGEFFVGPIVPPFATPDALANLDNAAWCRARENPQTMVQVSGPTSTQHG